MKTAFKAKIAGILLAGAGLALAAIPASAQITGIPVTDIPTNSSPSCGLSPTPVPSPLPTTPPDTTQCGGEAGYYAVDNGMTRFRYVTATVTAGVSLVDLNGDSGEDLGAIGVELCDPNTGEAFQLGVTSPASGEYQVVYGYGDLNGVYEDDCIQSGVLLPIPPGGFANTSPIPVTGGNAVLLTGLNTAQPIATGDSLTLSIYYNPRRHSDVEFTVCDNDQTWGCRNPTVGGVGYQNFYEFGIGGLTTNVDLTSPALNELSEFTSVAANFYASKTSFGSIYEPSHWNLREGVLVNSSSQAIMSPNESLSDNGSSFVLDEGSTSP